MLASSMRHSGMHEALRNAQARKGPKAKLRPRKPGKVVTGTMHLGTVAADISNTNTTSRHLHLLTHDLSRPRLKHKPKGSGNDKSKSALGHERRGFGLQTVSPESLSFNTESNRVCSIIRLHQAREQKCGRAVVSGASSCRPARKRVGICRRLAPDGGIASWKV